MIIKYNKLIRDNIPDIIKKDHKTPTTHIATDELADILEVAKALGKLQGLTLEDLEKLRQKKAQKRGGFDKRIVLEKVEE